MESFDLSGHTSRPRSPTQLSKGFDPLSARAQKRLGTDSTLSYFSVLVLIRPCCDAISVTKVYIVKATSVLIALELILQINEIAS